MNAEGRPLSMYLFETAVSEVLYAGFMPAKVRASLWPFRKLANLYPEGAAFPDRELTLEYGLRIVVSWDRGVPDGTLLIYDADNTPVGEITNIGVA